jgi:opacity protein-like surface antigen
MAMRCTRVLWVVWWAAAVVSGVAGPARAGDASTAPASDEGAAPANPFDDTGRLYFWFESGMNFTLDRHFAGDARVVPNSDVELSLGGGAGYNIDPHWGVELQVDGTDPWVRSESRGGIDRISVVTFVPAVRYRWALGDGRLMPYLTGGVGFSSNDVHGFFKPYAQSNTSSTTVVGSLSAGLDYFISENVAAGFEFRSLIHPDQDAEVTFQDPHTGRGKRYSDSLNLTSLSLLAHLRFFPGQQASADGERTFFLADHGPFDTDELRGYVAGLFGYEWIWDRNVGAGVHVREKGGDTNLTKGGALGLNFDGHWGAEVQLLYTMLDIRLSTGPRFAKMNVFEVLPALRYRYPLLGGRLVPFLLGGVGVSLLDTNEQRPLSVTQDGRSVILFPKFNPGSPAIVGMIGVGIEYFLNHHLSVGLTVPLHLYSAVDTELRQAGRKTMTGTADLTGLAMFLQLKAYLP